VAVFGTPEQKLFRPLLNTRVIFEEKGGRTGRFFYERRVDGRSSMTSLMSGKPSRLLHSQGMPAPHMHPSSSCHARSGWFSQTHPMPKQIGHILSIIGYRGFARRGFIPIAQFLFGLMVELLAFWLARPLPKLVGAADDLRMGYFCHRYSFLPF
jgi:hypothetical protein